LNTSELLLYGAVGGLAAIALAYQNWRASVKFALVFVLFEGAVRKWILPGASDLVYFIKDVFLIGAYLRFAKEYPTPLRFQWPGIPIDSMKLCLFVLALFALNPNVGSIPAAVLGLKAYLFYVPLVVVLPKLFDTRDEFIRGVFQYVLFSVPICLLGVLQSQSGAFDVINTYATGTEEWGVSQIGGSGLVRITGTFAYLSGHVVFLSRMHISEPTRPY